MATSSGNKTVKLATKMVARCTECYFSKIELNRKQIQTLEKLRDTLLPKLMSGEVKVEV